MTFNFRQVTGQSKFRSWKDWKKGEYVIGKVESLQPNQKNPKFQDIVIKLVEHNWKEKVTAEVGERFSINGNTGIQKGINEAGVAPGMIVKVVYGGMDTVKTGQWAGTKTHVTELYVAGQTSEDVVSQVEGSLASKVDSVL